MEKQKSIPLKNYILLAAVLTATIILVIYFYMWYSNYQDSRLNTPIIDKYMQVLNYNELSNYLIENKDCVIYTSSLNNEEIRNFEKDFRKLIISNSLQGKIIYLDLTSELDDKNIKKEIKETYQKAEDDMTSVPSIIIFKDRMIDSIYNIQKTDYDINSLEEYLIQKGVIDD